MPFRRLLWPLLILALSSEVTGFFSSLFAKPKVEKPSEEERGIGAPLRDLLEQVLKCSDHCIVVDFGSSNVESAQAQSLSLSGPVALVGPSFKPWLRAHRQWRAVAVVRRLSHLKNAATLMRRIFKRHEIVVTERPADDGFRVEDGMFPRRPIFWLEWSNKTQVVLCYQQKLVLCVQCALETPLRSRSS